MTDQSMQQRITEMMRLLLEARPMMQDKCCHFDWCIERSGVESDSQSEGFREIVDGMHPGCAPYRRWLDRYDIIVQDD